MNILLDSEYNCGLDDEGKRTGILRSKRFQIESPCVCPYIKRAKVTFEVLFCFVLSFIFDEVFA